MSHDPNDPLAPFRREPRSVASESEQKPLTDANEKGMKNEKLREAAPKLLEALQHIANANSEPYPDQTFTLEDAQALAHATIAKVAPEQQPASVQKDAMSQENQQLKASNAELVEALRNLADQAQEDMPIDSRTKHFETAMDDAFAAIAKATRELPTPEPDHDRNLEPGL